MTSAPAGGASISFWSSTSAGGESEQPSEGNSSTSTGADEAARGGRGTTASAARTAPTDTAGGTGRCYSRRKSSHPTATGPATPTASFASNTSTCCTSAVGTKAATRPTTVVHRPTIPAARAGPARAAAASSLIRTNARNRYT